VKPEIPPVAILCGGLATRLGPITAALPKALIELNGLPFLAHQLRLLRLRGVHRVVLCVGHHGDMIGDYVRDGSQFGLEAAISFDGPTLLGTAGAVRRAIPLLGATFFVLYGDSYLTCDYRAVAHAFERSGKQGLMTVFRNDGNYDTSNVEFNNGDIVRYDKTQVTPQMRHIDYGLGVFHASAFEALPDNAPRDLAHVYQDLLRAGQLAAFEVVERFYQIGSREGIEETAEFLRTQSPQSRS
jgi:NDP-sugar pyrophosphorylase family protein